MKKIIDEIKKAPSIALFAHIVPDGDALGSLFCLTHVLKKMGKSADAYVAGTVPKRLQFMADTFGYPYFTEIGENNKSYDLCIALDCGDDKRLGEYKDVFYAGKTTVNIDHHISNIGYGQLNYVEGTASSTGEILFGFFKEAGIALDETEASLLYGSIASDTGCFQFTNTSAKTHRIAASLMESGADIAVFNKKLFLTNSQSAMRVRAYVIDNLEYFFDGKAAIACISEENLKKLNATKEDTEGLTDIPKSIEGVEVAMIIKQSDGKTKVSMRTNGYVNASDFTKAFGGGGHARAAGCTMDMPLTEAKEKIVKALEEFI